VHWLGYGEPQWTALSAIPGIRRQLSLNIRRRHGQLAYAREWLRFLTAGWWGALVSIHLGCDTE
jgi:hypothetical protein